MSDLVRTEVKYLVNKSTYEILRKEYDKYLVHDKFYFQRVHNVYYDNDFDGIISHSIDKPVYKEKLRARAYENDGVLFPYAFIELKKKLKGIVYKRRLQLPLETLSNVIAGKLPYSVLGDSQIAREILFFIEQKKCYPKVYIGHDRYSLRGRDNKELRVTFDVSLVTRADDLYFGSSNLDEVSLDPDTYIMEIKADGGFPMWLCKLLTELRLFPASYSKYGKYYEAILKENRLGGVL